MAIHFKQHSKVGEKAIAEAGFSLGDGHSTSVEYERKTLGERGSILVCSGYFSV